MMMPGILKQTGGGPSQRASDASINADAASAKVQIAIQL
jgi:hypothetical protein